MTLPGQTAVDYRYLTTIADDVSRVSQVDVKVGGGASAPVPVAGYAYLGTDRLVGTDLYEPEARQHFYEGATSTNPYPDLDRFGRVVQSRWTGYKNESTAGTRDFYNVLVAYDAGSNITGVTDNVHKDSAGNRNFDVLYTMDELNRLIRAEEGTLSAGAISNTSRDERWLDSLGGLGLSQTGNWLNRRLDLDGNGAFTDAGDLDSTNTFNDVNELLKRDIDSDSTDDYTLVYDKVGNLVDDGEDYEYVYDAFGRLRKVLDRTDDSLVAEYAYNGLGFRIGWHYDVTDDGTRNQPDGVVDSNDPWYWFCYDESWRIVATFRDTDTDPKEVFVHHAAGLGGMGSSSYIDSIILRDRDANTAWYAAADSTREERVYYCQNWRADVSALLTDAGEMLEWVKYSAYGVPFGLPAGDTDSDGDWDSTDSSSMSGSGYEIRKDTDLDGDVDIADIGHANSITGSFQTLGRGTLTSAAVGNRRAYAGYAYDPTFVGANKHLYHVRHRVYDANLGRWTTRHPLGARGGMTNLYSYNSWFDPWAGYVRPPHELYGAPPPNSDEPCPDDCEYCDPPIPHGPPVPPGFFPPPLPGDWNPPDDSPFRGLLPPYDCRHYCSGWAPAKREWQFERWSEGPRRSIWGGPRCVCTAKSCTKWERKCEGDQHGIAPGQGWGGCSESTRSCNTGGGGCTFSVPKPMFSITCEATCKRHMDEACEHPDALPHLPPSNIKWWNDPQGLIPVIPGPNPFTPWYLPDIPVEGWEDLIPNPPIMPHFKIAYM